MLTRIDCCVPVLFAVALMSASSGALGDETDLRPWPVTRPANVPRASFELRLAVERPQPGGLTLTAPDGATLYLAADPVVTQSDIEQTEVGRSNHPPHYVAYIHFTPTAAARLGAFTREHIGARLAIVVDGKILLAPTIVAEFGPTAVIQGLFSRAEMTRLAERLAPARVAPHAQKPEGDSSSVKPGPRGQAPEETLLDRANRHFDSKKWKEARDAYVEYLKSEPENVNAMTDLGICYRELGEFEGALREFDRALALDPEHWQTLYNKIVLIGFDLKRNAEAQVLLSRLRALQPNNPDVEKLATALARQ